MPKMCEECKKIAISEIQRILEENFISHPASSGSVYPLAYILISDIPKIAEEVVNAI